MSTTSTTGTITIPADQAPLVRSGIYQHLGDQIEALTHGINAYVRDEPQDHATYTRLFGELQDALDLLGAAGYTEPQTPAPILLDLHAHRIVLLAAVSAALDTETDILAQLPAGSQFIPQAEHDIHQLTQLHQQLQHPTTTTTTTTGGDVDERLARLLIFAVLSDEYPAGRTLTELHTAHPGYSTRQINDTLTDLARHGLIQLGQLIAPSPTLQRLEEITELTI